MKTSLDTLLINGNLIDGKIILIENNVNLSELSHTCTIIDLKNATVLPGFIQTSSSRENFSLLQVATGDKTQ